MVFCALGQTGSQPARNVTFNGRNLTPRQWSALMFVERQIRFRFPDGDFWYDDRSGAVGVMGRQTAGFLPPGLHLGGRMPQNCSAGNTGVFVNGRELHAYDVAALSRLGPVWRGHYWLDGNGDYGLEFGPRLG